MGKKKLKSKREDNLLYNHLEKCIGLMRGKITKNDSKLYLLPLIFFKRISDIYDEESAEHVGTPLEGSELIHRFLIPEGCHWNDVRNLTENIGIAIVTAFNNIEKANIEDIAGIFSSFENTQWTNKQVFSDDLLKSIIEHISQIRLGNKDCTNDVIGQVYEYLMKHYADIAKTKAGEFYTPREVIRLMVKVLDPKPGEDIYDPACGTSGMLIEAFNNLEDKKAARGHLFGQESKPSTQSMGKINLFLHGAEEFQIAQGSTFERPGFLDKKGRLRQFDIVLANPPFSLSDWGIETWPKDPYGRCIFGTPTEDNADFAWLQHMICSMKPDGRMAVVMPEGVLFKQDALRIAMVKSNKLVCVLKLPDKLFYATLLSPCVLFLKNNKKSGEVRFVDATEIFTKTVSRNTLTNEDIDEIYSLIVGDEEIEGKTHVATMEEMSAEGYELTIGRYVKKPFVDMTPPMSDVIKKVVETEKLIKTLENKISVLEKECGINE